MNLPKYRCTRATHFSIGLAAILGTALLTVCVEPWSSFSLPVGAVPKRLLQANGVLAYSTPWGWTAASKSHLVPCVAGMLVVSLIAGFSLRRQHMSLHASAIIDRAGQNDDIDIHDDLLIKAGLRNLLGVQDNRMARELENKRRHADDLEKRMNDICTQSERTMEELVKSREKAVKLEKERDAIKRDLTETTVELEEFRNTCERAVEQNAKTLEDLAKSRAQVLEMKAERDVMKKDIAKVTKELENFRDSFEGAAQQSANIKKRLDASQAKALKLEAERDTMKEDIVFLKELLDRGHTMDELVEARSKVLQLEVERDSLKKQLNKATSNTETQSTFRGAAHQSGKTIDNAAESRAKTIELEAERDLMQKELRELAKELKKVRNTFHRAAQQSAHEFAELQASLTKAMAEKAQIAAQLERNVGKFKDAGETAELENGTAEAECGELNAQEQALKQASSQTS